jgi:glutamate N-acetyltransferase / amino-acid N-acetyltransferase
MNNWHMAAGYRYSGIVSGLRSEPNRRDIAVIASDTPAIAAGAFTQNRICAAPVQISRKRLPRPDARAIVICSGNANAATGDQGLRDAERMTELVATDLGCRSEQVLVASTGVIGRPLPMPILEAGIPKAVKGLSPKAEALNDAAHAILTTDTRIKVATRDCGKFKVTGFAKGAAMIGPNLATMLGFVLTDALIPPPLLKAFIKDACDLSFNCVSVEGHTSTNDTVFLMANGANGRGMLGGDDAHNYFAAVRDVCAELARAIAADAEGADHLITLHIRGAASFEDARRMAKAIAESPLVKTAVYGADPNWGRIVSAAGYSGVPFDERSVSLVMGEMKLYERGQPLPFDAKLASAYLKNNREVSFTLSFEPAGPGQCTFYTCDLTTEYVKLNADYTT